MGWSCGGVGDAGEEAIRGTCHFPVTPTLAGDVYGPVSQDGWEESRRSHQTFHQQVGPRRSPLPNHAPCLLLSYCHHTSRHCSCCGYCCFCCIIFRHCIVTHLIAPFTAISLPWDNIAAVDFFFFFELYILVSVVQMVLFYKLPREDDLHRGSSVPPRALLLVGRDIFRQWTYNASWSRHPPAEDALAVRDQ